MPEDRAAGPQNRPAFGVERWVRAHQIDLVPLEGIACPGLIEEDGSIKRGGQNLPGNWESKHFNLPRVLRARIPRIGNEETLVVMHNDAVVQGLSELPDPRASSPSAWRADSSAWLSSRVEESQVNGVHSYCIRQAKSHDK